MRAWPGWGQINPTQDILVHLTQFPTNVRFISCREIADHGVPADATVLLNCGEPGSSWSGGYFWNDERLVDAITEFVADGGGFIGIGAPSHYPKNSRTWQLADLMGIDYAGATSEAAKQRLFTANDAIRAGTRGRARHFAKLQRTGQTNWITQDFAAETNPLRVNVKVRPVREHVKLLASADGEGFSAPLVTARSHGDGRACYISGYSTKADYRRLLQRTIFRTASAENQLRRLYAEDPNILLYLYPQRRLLIVYNPDTEAHETNVQLDVSLAGLSGDAQYRVKDVLTGKTVDFVDGSEAASAIGVSVPARTIRFLRLQD